MAGRKTIAVDCDDVLADHAEDVVAWTNERFGTNLTIRDYTDHWTVMWQLDSDAVEARAVEYHSTGRHGTFTNKADSLDVLRWLAKDYDLVVVTARRKEIVQSSLEWIKASYPGIFKDVRFVPIWTPGNTVTKADICNEIGAEYLIDDLPKHCNIAAEAGIVSLVFGDYGWNRNEEIATGVHRVKDWQSVKEFFEHESKQ